jgi:hypothetical protein
MAWLRRSLLGGIALVVDGAVMMVPENLMGRVDEVK